MTTGEIDILFKEAVKKGRENGSVLHFSKAWELFPVEDEAHEGKLEYRLKEAEDITA